MPAARLSADPPGQNAVVDRRWRIGASLVALSLATGLAMQAVAGQWFPPPISVSQYGLGPWGFLFSACVVTMAAAPLLVAPRRSRLAAGLAGALVMALVRTDPSGDQTSPNSRVHTVGAVLFLIALPLGVGLVLRARGGVLRWLAVVEWALVEAAGLLLVAAALGVDTAGMGPARSWAFWQCVASVGCWLMVLHLTVLTRPGRRGHRAAEDHTDRSGRRSGAASILVQD